MGLSEDRLQDDDDDYYDYDDGLAGHVVRVGNQELHTLF
jgi:hypothetical protein